MPDIIARSRISLLISLLIFCNVSIAYTQPATREYQVKAVFLYNFTQFVTWPPTAFSSNSSPLVIGIIGKDPFGSYIDEAVAGEKVNGHPIIIQRYKTPEDVRDCQMLFVASGDSKKINEILAGIKTRNILTVSDDPGFLQLGGMMRFYTTDDKVHIQVNLEAVQAGGLTISSKLLRLVDIFTPFKNS